MSQRLPNGRPLTHFHLKPMNGQFVKILLKDAR